jgi:prepilin-type N-terminal cleavage/methylation domain-containing protein/prepilin-type processing-associated H-X9-DG protein
MRCATKCRAAFSLVELLVVIGIIALLVAILTPVIATARKMARSAACMATLQQWGQAHQMYLGSHRVAAMPDMKDDTALYWWEALTPYIGDPQRPLLCPEAQQPSDNSHPSGTAGYAWRRHTFDTRWPNRVVRGTWLGSYEFNRWVYDLRPPGTTEARHYIHYPASSPERIPLIGDGCEPFSLCFTNDQVPHNLQEPEDGIDRGISTYCIDRHRMAVNVVFLDGHAEHVPLADLWTLKWSATFVPRNVVVPVP